MGSPLVIPPYHVLPDVPFDSIVAGQQTGDSTGLLDEDISLLSLHAPWVKFSRGSLEKRENVETNTGTRNCLSFS